MRWVWAAAFLLRRLRAEAGGALLLLGLVLATSFMSAAGPRLFNLVADAALRDGRRRAPPVRRSVQLSNVVPLAGGDPLAEIRALGDGYERAFPAAVRDVTGSRDIAFTSPRFGVADP